MKLDVARWLVSDAGRAAAAELSGLDTAQTSLSKRLRKEQGPDRAAALLDQEAGRRSLVTKHRRSAEWFTTRRAAEQASSEATAAWRARRFPKDQLILDLCCGVGIDTEALAARGRVLAVDADPALLELARANLSGAAGCVDFAAATVPPLPAHADYAFCDPDRRRDGRRQRDPEAASPRLSELLSAGKGLKGLAVKLSPACDLKSLEAQLEATAESRFEFEFVSHGRELKEIVLWTGELAAAHRSVSVPEIGFRGSDADAVSWSKTDRPGAWLLDPDPALSRSGLHLGAPGVPEGAISLLAGGYATADSPQDHPLFKTWRIETVLGPEPSLLNAHFRSRGVGRVDLSKRGVDLDLSAYRKRLKIPGPRSEGRQLFFLTLNGRLSCIVCFLRNPA